VGIAKETRNVEMIRNDDELHFVDPVPVHTWRSAARKRQERQKRIGGYLMNRLNELESRVDNLEHDRDLRAPSQKYNRYEETQNDLHVRMPRPEPAGISRRIKANNPYFRYFFGAVVPVSESGPFKSLFCQNVRSGSLMVAQKWRIPAHVSRNTPILNDLRQMEGNSWGERYVNGCYRKAEKRVPGGKAWAKGIDDRY